MPSATRTDRLAGRKWSLLWLLFLVVWLLVRVVLRQPSLILHALKRRLHRVVQLKSLEGNITYDSDVAFPLKVALESFQGEEMRSFHGRQNEVVGATAVERATSLTFYRLNEQTPSVLAIARFTVCNESNNEVVKVCEDHYADTPDELCRLEYEVMEAVSHGIDVDVSSWYELGTFPDISSLIEDE